MAIDRGNTVFFKQITFSDEAGDQASVDTASLTLSYQENGCAKQAEVALTFVTDAWVGQWESIVADPGVVYGYLKGVRLDPALTCVKDFKFKLLAGPANEDVNG